MTIKDILNRSVLDLKNISESPELDAAILLSFVLKKSKEYLFANPEKELTTEQFSKFNQLLARRKNHEPIAYIINKKEFFDIDFFVDKRVLIPRPETEILVEEIIREAKIKNQELKIVDVGTGSGCIAISLAKNLSNAKIYATDISKNALDVTKINAKKNKVNINLRLGNLLEPLNDIKVDIICANLPYLTIEQLNLTEEDVKKFEPKSALITKEETTLYSQLLDQAPKYLNKINKNSIIIILEIDPIFRNRMVEIVKNKMPQAKFEIKKDLGGCERIMIIKKD